MKLPKNRAVWFVMGILLLPSLKVVKALVYPNAKEAMGFTGFYEENYLIYTFLGDHRYSLSFPGDHDFFHRYAKRLGFRGHAISETEYQIKDDDGQGSHGVEYDEETKSITYRSESR